MIKPATKMMTYQKSDDEETAAVLLVPTILPTAMTTTTTTMDRRSSLKWMGRVASVAGMLLLVIGGASSTPDVTPRRVPNKQSKNTSKCPETTDSGLTTMTTTAAEGLIVATGGDGNPRYDCEPATGTFSGISTTGKWREPFQTCYYLAGGFPSGDENSFCWSNSMGADSSWYECVPVAPAGVWIGWAAERKREIQGFEGRGPSFQGTCGKPCQKLESKKNKI